MNKKYLITFLLLLLLCGIAQAQEPITLKMGIDKNEGLAIRDRKEYDGDEFAKYTGNYVIENTSDILPGDDVSLDVCICFEVDEEGDDKWIKVKEPDIPCAIWSYTKLIGEDAYKYKLEITEEAKNINRDRFEDAGIGDDYLFQYQLDGTLRILQLEGAMIDKLNITITAPTGTYTYGESLVETDIKATITPSDIPGKMEYYVKQGDNYSGDMNGKMLGAGTNEMYIRFVPKENDHYTAEPVYPTIIVNPKKLTFTNDIKITGKLADNTKDIKSAQIKSKPSPIGVVGDDEVYISVDLTKTKYPSAEPGIYDVTVYLKLAGKDAANYELAQTTIAAKAEIASEQKEIILAGAFVILPKYYDGTPTIYKGQVVPPAIKNLDPGDQVEIVVDYSNTKFTDYKIDTYPWTRITYSIAGDDAYKYKSTEKYDYETGEITEVPTIAFNSTATDGAYQLVYTHSQLSTDLKMSNLRNEHETDKYYIKNNNVTNKMLTAGEYVVTAELHQYGNKVTEKEIKVKVSPLKLEVSEPEISHTKVYDGNTSVTLTGKNSVLTNKLASDDVAIASQKQVYDTPEIGSGKTITVSFELSGDLTDKYIAPDNIVYTDGAITPGKIEVSNIAVVNSDYCQGEEAKVVLTISNGLPEAAKITFDATAKSNGFVDFDVTSLTAESATEKSFTLTIPADAEAGVYNGEISLTDPMGTVSQKYQFEINVNYSSKYIKSKFTDVVFISNAEGQFAEYQWYKDGKKLEGETMQFYNDLNGVKGFYSADVVTVEGKKLKVCGVQLNAVDVPETKVLAKRGEIYPNPAKASQPINIRLVNFNEEEIATAYMFVFNSLGNRVLQRSHLSEEFTIELPKGSYTVSIICKQQRLSYKIIVND